jgi:hypothetical protein
MSVFTRMKVDEIEHDEHVTHWVDYYCEIPPKVGTSDPDLRYGTSCGR